jgi:hypothetical protein
LETKTIVLENTPQYDRIRTQCNDQNYVRDYYMNQVSVSKAIAAVAFLTDILIDMNIMTMKELKAQGKLTPEQEANLDKIITYHNQLTSLTLASNNWEMDWVYGEVKLQQNQLNMEFFKKRTELNLGDPLPITVK